MELTDLRYFQAVAATGGVTAAARRLHCVPSNVSTRIRNLEAALGAELFLRGPRRMLLSPRGRNLLAYAERILALAGEAAEAMQDHQPRGLLRLGCLECTAGTRLPAAFAWLRRTYPVLRIELRVGTTRDLTAAVRAGELEAALVGDPRPEQGLRSLELPPELAVLVTPPGGPPVRSARDLPPGTPLLAFAAGCALRARAEAWYAAARRAPDGIVELASYHAMLGCVAAGMGVALVSAALVDLFVDRAALARHELPPRFARVATALLTRDEPWSGRVSALVASLQAVRPPAREPRTPPSPTTR